MLPAGQEAEDRQLPDENTLWGLPSVKLSDEIEFSLDHFSTLPGRIAANDQA
jgi:hypothetical protein